MSSIVDMRTFLLRSCTLIAIFSSTPSAAEIRQVLNVGLCVSFSGAPDIRETLRDPLANSLPDKLARTAEAQSGSHIHFAPNACTAWPAVIITIARPDGFPRGAYSARWEKGDGTSRSSVWYKLELFENGAKSKPAPEAIDELLRNKIDLRKATLTRDRDGTRSSYAFWNDSVINAIFDDLPAGNGLSPAGGSPAAPGMFEAMVTDYGPHPPETWWPLLSVAVAAVPPFWATQTRAYLRPGKCAKPELGRTEAVITFEPSFSCRSLVLRLWRGMPCPSSTSSRTPLPVEDPDSFNVFLVDPEYDRVHGTDRPNECGRKEATR